MVGAAIFGIPVAKSLSAGGFQDPGSESAKATQLLSDKFGQGDMQLLITVTAPAGPTSAPARAVATDIVDHLAKSPHVASVTSAWTAPPAAARALISKDGTSGLIVAGITGGENDAQKYAQTLSDELVHDHQGVTVRAGGMAMVYAQINHQNERDLVLMESIAIPLSLIVLVWVFGGLLAAALPVAVGLLAIAGSMAVLRVITFSTDVSIFALNLSTAMGLALAIAYTLSMAVIVLFPMFCFKSFAYGGIATVAFAAVAAVVVTPAAIVLLGSRLDSLDVRRLVRPLSRRPEPVPRPVEQLFWYRSAKFVMRRAVPIGLAVVTVLLLLGAPFLGVRWGMPDDRVLPHSDSAHQVGDQLRNDFGDNSANAVTVVVPDAHGLTAYDLNRYAADLSRVPDVSAVSAPGGTFVGGNRVRPPSAAAGVAQGSALLTVSSIAPLFSGSSATQLDRLHAVPGPAGRSVEMTGTAQINRDSVEAITSRLPLVLGLIAVITFVLLFLLTGSVVLPLKALVLNVLSLTAAFGALVWIFQDGHLGALGTTPTGTLVANLPVLLFCIAFGLSMDYEVFLMSRIREYWVRSRAARPGTADAGASNEESVALGVARSARVITAAALVMSISFAALIAAHVQFMRLFGVGMTLAVVVDVFLF